MFIIDTLVKEKKRKSLSEDTIFALRYTSAAIGNPIKIITLYRNARLHSDLSGSVYQRQFARVDTKEGSKSSDFRSVPNWSFR